MLKSMSKQSPRSQTKRRGRLRWEEFAEKEGLSQE